MAVPRTQVVEWLNAIEWRHPEKITPEAEALIADYLMKIRLVIKDVMAKKGINAVDADRFAQTAGHDTPDGIALLDDLFSKVTFKGAGVRTSLIANITAAYCWGFDRELCSLPNPWLPLLELYELGYTTSGEDDPDGNGLTLLVGYKNAIGCYRIY